MTEDEKKEKKKELNTIEKTIHKEVQGTKKRTFYISTDAGDVMVESSMGEDTAKQLLVFALTLVDETKKSKEDLKYVS